MSTEVYLGFLFHTSMFSTLSANYDSEAGVYSGRNSENVLAINLSYH